MQNILGIETSCDETGIAIYSSEKGLVAHALHSQIPTHQQYGGVVPELASRDHIRQILPLIQTVLAEANLIKQDLDAVAYTAGPGLIGALMVGATFGRSLAYGLGIPAIGVHHMEGHLLAPMLEDNPPEFPFLALLVSGGHTMLVAVKGIGEYTILGDTLDDAVGEAFDKTAKLLGLGYPGGPAIEAIAKQGQLGQFQLPRPMINRPGLDFSFSGLKTHVRQTWQKAEQSEQAKADLAYEFQQAVVDTLVRKCRRALTETGFATIVIAGGVSANQALRQGLEQAGSEHHFKVYYPRLEFCTDNGAMIAYAGYRRLIAGDSNDLSIDVRARWGLEEL